jgi:hypothetical protein
MPDPVKSRGQVVIVTGSRDWTDKEAIRIRLNKYPRGTIVLHGAASGADQIAERIAREMNMQPVRHPYFSDLGKAGGPARNALLVALGGAYQAHGYEVVVEAFPLPQSRGTWDCVRRADEALLSVITGGVERPR